MHSYWSMVVVTIRDWLQSKIVCNVFLYRQIFDLKQCLSWTLQNLLPVIVFYFFKSFYRAEDNAARSSVLSSYTDRRQHMA